MYLIFSTDLVGRKKGFELEITGMQIKTLSILRMSRSVFLSKSKKIYYDYYRTHDRNRERPIRSLKVSSNQVQFLSDLLYEVLSDF